MISLNDLEIVMKSQKKFTDGTASEVERTVLNSLPINNSKHALIISGIRRCGKSTLLGQIARKIDKPFFFLNFDTPKLFNFEIADFELLDKLIEESQAKHLFFDEIQSVSGWELYIRQKLDEGFKVIVTGSNASMLSQELGTKLTGRHVTKELFPFSFKEFLQFTNLETNHESFKKYLEMGGFPEYLTTENQDILDNLFEDIIYRDIASRNGIRDVKSLKRLLIFLITNVSNLVTAGGLRQPLGIKSSATILDYFSFFEQSYLISLMPRFSYSYRAQLINPRKVYIIDNGLINTVSSSVSQDIGRKFENTVFWQLRRKNKELFYFNENGIECDFVICKNNKPTELLQVCSTMHLENTKREQAGLFDAMRFFNINTGTILTLNQRNTIIHEGKRIEVMPAHEYF